MFIGRWCPDLANSYSPALKGLISVVCWPCSLTLGAVFVFCMPGTLVQSGSALHTCKSRSAIGVGEQIARLRHWLPKHEALSLNPKNPREPGLSYFHAV